MGCSKKDARQKDPSLQSALDELTRLNSFVETGVTYPQYSERLLVAKGNIDLALRHTNDEQAKIGIKKALDIYITTGEEWKNSIDSGREPAGLQERWEQAKKATTNAANFAFADNAARETISESENPELQDAVKADTANGAQSNTTGASPATAAVLPMASVPPGGTGFSVNAISVITPDGWTGIGPGYRVNSGEAKP